MKNQSVSLLFFLIIFSLKAASSPIEVAQWIPWKFLSSSSIHLPLSFEYQSDKLNLSWQDWQPQGGGILLKVTEGQAVKTFDSKGLVIQGQNFDASLQVQKLTIDQTVVQEVHGNKITIKVQAVCDPFQIHVPAFHFQMNLPFANQGDFWAPHLSDIHLQIPEKSWTISAISCQGPLGLDSKIADMIQTSLQNSDSIQQLLQNFLGPRIDLLAQDSWKQIVSSGLESLHVQKMSDPAQNGFMLVGALNPASTGPLVNLPELSAVEFSKDLPQLVISNAGFESLVQAGVEQMTAQKVDLQSIAGFQKLSGNRFLQFFLWPDLLQFSKKSPFVLSTLPGTQTELHSNGQGLWNIRTQTRGKVQAERNGEAVNYLQWGLGLGAQLQAVVQDSHLQFNLLNPKTNFQWDFDKNYKERFRPFGGISATVIEQATHFLFTNRSTVIALPVIKLQNQDWKLNGFNQQKDVILVNWKTAAQPLGQ